MDQLIMTSFSCISNRKHFLKVVFFICFFSSFMSQSRADCELLKSLKPNETRRETEFLNKIKPLTGKSFQAKDVINSTEYIYKVSICAEVDGQKKSHIGAIQIENNKTHILGQYNQTDITGGTDWIFLTYYGGDNYSSHCNSTGRITKIMIICDPDSEVGNFEVLEERKFNPDDCFYLFELGSKLACTVKSKPGLSSGSVFCILFFTVVLVYLVIGFLYKRIVVGAKGLDQIPNYSFWKDFGSLQADGCDFLCRLGSRQESHAYRGIDDHLKEEEERDDQLLNM